MIKDHYIQISSVLADQCLRSVTTFIAGVIVGRKCVPEEYGIYVVLMSIIVSCGSMHSAIIGIPYSINIPYKNKDQRKEYFGSVIIAYVLSLLLIVTVGLIVLLAMICVKVSFISKGLLLSFIFALGAILLRDMIRQILLAEMHMLKNLVLGCSIFFPIIIFFGQIYNFDNVSVAYIFLITGILSLIPVLFFLYFKRNDFIFDKKAFNSDMLGNWKSGRWLLARASVTLLSSPLYGWMLAGFHGKSAIAVMGACMLPISLLSPIGNATKSYVIPKASHYAQQCNKRVRDFIFLVIFLLSIIFLIFMIILCVFSQEIMQAIFAGKYLPSKWLLLAFAIQMFLIIISGVIDSGLISLKQTGVVFRSELIAVLFTLVIGLYLVYKFSIWGVAIGMTLSVIAGRLFGLAYFLKLTKDEK